MKIAIDFREGARKNRAGKGEYVYQLTKGLLALMIDVTPVLVIEAGQTVDLPGHYETKVVPGSSWLWQLRVAWWLNTSADVDLYFATTSVIIPAISLRVPTVTTMFDFTSWRFHERHLPKAVMIEKLLLPIAIRRARHLLAISEFTKDETEALFGVAGGKITVTPLAVDARFEPAILSPERQAALRTKYGLPESYILYLGTIEPRKNIARLIEAFIATDLGAEGTKLVLAGGRGWYADEILAGRNDDVVVAGYVDDSDRPDLYRCARAFAFPSLYEGFGLPPLEAMACGVPAIVSDRASLPEVVGQGALTVPAEDIGRLAQALVTATIPSPARDQLIRQGLLRAQDFSWTKTAQLTHALLVRVITGAKRSIHG